MSSKLNIIILAAGKGTRMKSKKLKVLHPFAGSTIIDSVLDTARKLNPDKVIMVYGHEGLQLQSHFSQEKLIWVEQKNPQGTGHAVHMAIPSCDDDARAIVLVGDAPLIEHTDLENLLEYNQAVITAELSDPFGYGRIVTTSDGAIEMIVEEKDADDSIKGIKEVNSGIIMAQVKDLKLWLSKIDTNNAQNELYLTDVVSLAHKDGKSFNCVKVRDYRSIKGINDRKQLAECESIRQESLRDGLMKNGVYLANPDSVTIRGSINHGIDISIDTGVILEGSNDIRDNVSIGAYCNIKNCELGPGTRIAPHCILENVITKGDCDIGPYARLRPGTVIGKQAKVGNFVETKKAVIGDNSKASHLTYLGDCEIGENVNIGAGTITCNYDGVNKFKTIIEDDVFIGSDSQLVAPVTVRKGATIGAGTTLTKDAEEGKLTLSRTKQKTIEGWQKPVKKY